jgi:hypothetical protein
MNRTLTALALALTLLATSADAFAADHYVATTGSDGNTPCDNAAMPCKTIGTAVSESTDGDTIHIAPGAYTQSVTVQDTLNFVGAGSGSTPGANTILTGNASFALRLLEGGSVTGMRLVGANAADGIGLVLGAGSAGPLRSYAVSNVTAVGGASQASPASAVRVSDDGATGAEIAATFDDFTATADHWPQPVVGIAGANVSTTFTDSTIDIPAIAQGMWVRGGARVVFTRSQTVQHNDGFNESRTGISVKNPNSEATIEHSRVVSGMTPLSVSNGGSALVRNSLVAQLRTVTPADLSDNAAIFVSDNDGLAAQATIIGSTVVAHGPNSDAALRVTVSPAGGTPSAMVRNSVLSNVDTTTEGSSADLMSDVFMQSGTATVTADHSAYSTVITSGGGIATAAGSGTNVSGDPLFVDPAGADFRLQIASPLIDGGDPAIVTTGELDLLGNPRSLDSDHDCMVAPDIGAYEITGNELDTCPAPQPQPDPVGGTSGGDSNPGPSGDPQPAAVADTLAPLLGQASFTPKRFRKRSSLRFTLSEQSDLTIVIQRRVGKRWRKATTLTRKRAAAGKLRITFRGTMGKRALKPGRYRAVITAKDGAGNRSKPKTASFAIIRR